VSAGRAAEAGGHRLAHQVVIGVPRPSVWRLVEEPEALMQWVHGLRSVTSPEGRPGGFALGATFEQRIRIGMIASSCRGEVIAFDAPSSLGVQVQHALFRLVIDYRFRAAGRQTEVACSAAIEGAALGTVVPRRKVEAVTFEILEEHLAALKALAEGGQAR
jgi:carbon monoxide dehydrogenase subunit G